MYARQLTTHIERQLHQPEVILIYGARRTGKSTMLDMLKEKYPEMAIFNCENPVVSETLQSKNMESIKQLFDGKTLIALDEAQVVPHIGSILKLIVDNKSYSPKIIATGSSSFDLANQTGEPLTGRNIALSLFPLSINEIAEKTGWLPYRENMQNYLVYGSYPGIVDLSGDEKKRRLLQLSSDYLFKDIFKFEQLRNPDLLRQLLKALALQLGSQVSFNELANLLRTSASTIERYLDLLEKTFVIYKLGSYSTNLRNEIKKSRKYYFTDNGIRNALINNFSDISGRTDMGALWENYCISEFRKIIEYQERFSNLYFWRTYDGSEIDLVEEKDGELFTFEFKWSDKKKSKLPRSFAAAYKTKNHFTISPVNIHELLTVSD
jgi:uncharacterized protein